MFVQLVVLSMMEMETAFLLSTKNKIGIRQEIKILKHSKFDNATPILISDSSSSIRGPRELSGHLASKFF